MSDEKRELPDPLLALFDVVSGRVFDVPEQQASKPAEQPAKVVKDDGTPKRKKQPSAVTVNIGDVWERKPGARAGAAANAEKAKGKAKEGPAGDDGAGAADE